MRKWVPNQGMGKKKMVKSTRSMDPVGQWIWKLVPVSFALETCSCSATCR